MYLGIRKRGGKSPIVIINHPVKYLKYLKSDYWQIRRKKELKKARYKCFCCGAKAWQVHHNNYKNKSDEKKGDLIALCGNCHKRIHEEVKKGKIDLLNAHIKRKEYINYQINIMKRLDLID
jgi:5-methylcytosine-specific restriction endonuclease McrA